MEELKVLPFFVVKTYPNFQRMGIPLLRGKNLPNFFNQRTSILPLWKLFFGFIRSWKRVV
jgi:hypothetical protein